MRTAILNGETKTGITIIKIDKELDHGDILSAVNYEIIPDDYYSKILNDLARLGAKLLVEILPDYIHGKIKPISQNHLMATFTRKFKMRDGKINLDDSAENAYNKIRALNPEPGVFFNLKNCIILFLQFMF